MKFVLLHEIEGECDILLRTASEFPPISVTKWLPDLGSVDVQYGRARLARGFAYFYAPTIATTVDRWRGAEKLVRGLPADGMFFAASARTTELSHLIDVAAKSRACLIEILKPDFRQAQDVLCVKKQSTEANSGTFFEFCAVLEDRKRLLTALWELYQELHKLKR